MDKEWTQEELKTQFRNLVGVLGEAAKNIWSRGATGRRRPTSSTHTHACGAKAWG